VSCRSSLFRGDATWHQVEHEMLKAAALVLPRPASSLMQFQRASRKSTSTRCETLPRTRCRFHVIFHSQLTNIGLQLKEMNDAPQSNPASYETHASALWNFLAPQQTPEAVDAVFVFGGVNLRVPEWAAELIHAQYASTVLVSGGAGSRTHLHFDQPEADVFVQVLRDKGVSSESVVVESAATNTGQNVEYGMAKLLKRVPRVSSLLLVSTPFIMRRCVATFKHQYPDIRTVACPPRGSYREFVDRPQTEFIDRLVAEVERLDAYARSGFIAPVDIPDGVRVACDYFRGQRT